MAEQKEQWAKVPVEAIEDERLSPTEFRVLVALLSFADGSTGWTWPTARATISSRCGVSEQNISRATAALVRYGWLEKFGNGGRSCPAKYRIVNPFFTRPDSGQVKGETRPDSGRVNGKTRPESDTKTRPESNTKPVQILDGAKNSFIHTLEQTARTHARTDAPIQAVSLTEGRWQIDNIVYDHWVSAYQAGRPALATEDWIETELAKASAWLATNSKGRKTLAGFVTDWLNRAYERMQAPEGQRGARQ